MNVNLFNLQIRSAITSRLKLLTSCCGEPELPHTGVTSLHMFVCMLAYLDQPLTVKCVDLASFPGLPHIQFCSVATNTHMQCSTSHHCIKFQLFLESVYLPMFETFHFKPFMFLTQLTIGHAINSVSQNSHPSLASCLLLAL